MSRIMEFEGLYLSMDATIQQTRRVVSPFWNSHYNARFGLDLKLGSGMHFRMVIFSY